VGSGGTSAGLELGARIHGLRAKIWGVNVCDDAAHFCDLIYDLVARTQEAYELDLPLSREDIGLIDGYVGDGYGKARLEELQCLTALARREGIVLDPVYGNKAFFALTQELDGPRLSDAKNILFLHTGGVFGLAPHADALSRAAGR
jgi:D-cysteine desulfhydrase